MARSVARRARELLLALRRDSTAASEADLGAEGDRRSHDLIVSERAARRPQDHVLSEEAAGDPARLSAARVWIVDPLDGTREYRDGRDDWAVRGPRRRRPAGGRRRRPPRPRVCPEHRRATKRLADAEAGVAAYWLVDPDVPSLTVFELGAGASVLTSTRSRDRAAWRMSATSDGGGRAGGSQ